MFYGSVTVFSVLGVIHHLGRLGHLRLELNATKLIDIKGTKAKEVYKRQGQEMESIVFNHMGWDLQAARRTTTPHSPPWLYATTEALKDFATETSCQGCRVGGFWVESKLHSFSNTRIRSSLSESDIPNGSFFGSHS